MVGFNGAQLATPPGRAFRVGSGQGRLSRYTLLTRHLFRCYRYLWQVVKQ
jgi:hypothetical protein